MFNFRTFMATVTLFIMSGLATLSADGIKNLPYKYWSTGRADSKSIEGVEKRVEKGVPIILLRDSSDMNILGVGSDLTISFASITPRTIKYIVFAVQFKNNVGDVIKDDLTGEAYKQFTITGPIKQTEKVEKDGMVNFNYNYATWDNAFWSSSEVKSDIILALVEFMNGEQVIYQWIDMYTN